MAKFKGKGVVIAGLVAGAASFLSKKENRDKVQQYFSLAKDKVNEKGSVQDFILKAQSNGSESKSNSTKDVMNTAVSDIAAVGQKEYVEETIADVALTAADNADTVLEGNHMLGEGGAQTVIHEYNDEQQK